jgi:MFS family permease
VSCGDDVASVEKRYIVPVNLSVPKGRAASSGFALAVLASASAITALHFNIIILALPHIARELSVPPRTLQWVMTGFSLAYSGCLLLGGRAADCFGRRRVFIVSLLIFGAGSAIGAAAESVAAIIIARTVQGVGGSLLFPSTISLLNTIFAEGVERNKALGVWSLISSSGATLGALAGGVLVASFGWQSIFLVNVPLVVLTAIGALMALPPDRPRAASRSFDVAGAAAAAASVTLFLLLLTRAPAEGLLSPTSMALVAASVAAALGCFAIERWTPDPLIDGNILGNRSVLTAMILAGVLMGTFMTLPYFLTLMFQNAFGYSPIRTGIAFLLPSISIMAGTQAGARLAIRVGVRSLLTASLLAGAAGTLGLALSIGHSAGFLAMVPGFVLFGLGQGATWSGMWILAGQGVPADRQGVASGLVSTSMWIGGAAGLALLVWTSQSATLLQDGSSAGTVELAGTRAVLIAASAGILVAALVAATIRPPRATKRR